MERKDGEIKMSKSVKKEILSLEMLRERKSKILENLSVEYDFLSSGLLEAKANLRRHEKLFQKDWEKYRKEENNDPVAKQRFIVYCDELSNLIKIEQWEEKDLEEELEPFLKILSVIERDINRLEKFEEKRRKSK
jgi:hypothetical protein